MASDRFPDDDVVCQCYLVDRGTIRRAIREHGLTSLWDIGRELGAGLACRACRFDPGGLGDLLEEAAQNATTDVDDD